MRIHVYACVVRSQIDRVWRLVLRSEDGVRQFIATRNFIRKYKQNTKTPFPPDNVYQVRYLKPDEVEFVAAEILKQQCAAAKTPSGVRPPMGLRPCP